MASARLRTIILITIFFSLLLHLIFIIFFATHHMHIQQIPAPVILVDTPEQKKTTPQKKTPKSEPVRLAAQEASQFAFDPAKVKELGLPYAPQQETALDTREKTQQQPHQQAPDIPEPEKSIEPTHQQHHQESDSEKHEDAQASPASPEIKLDAPEKNPQAIAAIPLDDTPQTDDIPYKITAITPPTHKLPYPPNLLKKKTTPPENTHDTKTLPTAAQLTNGFVAYLQNKNTGSAITVIDGEKRSRRATAQELMLQRYGEKLVYCIECSQIAIAHEKEPPRIINSDKKAENIIAIAYDRKNRKHNVYTYALSEHKEFDDYCLLIVQNAINTFPPAPDSVDPENESLTMYYSTLLPVTTHQKFSFNHSWVNRRR